MLDPQNSSQLYVTIWGTSSHQIKILPLVVGLPEYLLTSENSCPTCTLPLHQVGPIVVSVEWGWKKRWEEILLINLPAHTAVKFKSLKTDGGNSQWPYPMSRLPTCRIPTFYTHIVVAIQTIYKIYIHTPIRANLISPLPNKLEQSNSTLFKPHIPHPHPLLNLNLRLLLKKCLGRT